MNEVNLVIFLYVLLPILANGELYVQWSHFIIAFIIVLLQISSGLDQKSTLRASHAGLSRWVENAEILCCGHATDAVSIQYMYHPH